MNTRIFTATVGAVRTWNNSTRTAAVTVLALLA